MSPYRDNYTPQDVERLRRRNRALERALRMTSPLRALARWYARVDFHEIGHWLRRMSPLVLLVVFVVTGVLKLASCAKADLDHARRCAVACAREGRVLYDTSNGVCACEQRQTLKVVVP